MSALPVPLLERLFELPDEAATEDFGQHFAHALTAAYNARFSGLQVHLRGELGAGKTALVRAVLRALGFTGRVRSPTYTIVEPYSVDIAGHPLNPLEIYHFDLYRFTDPAEWEAAGFREYFDTRALCLIEWPERAGSLLGAPDLMFTFEIAGAGRRLFARALTQTGKMYLAAC